MTKYIFITGGVTSSLGKGVACAALGSLLRASNLKVILRKFDPYLNVDPGTMNPIEHGEVFVTSDGAETDLDLGHYERFASIECKNSDSISSGKIYSYVIAKERKGDYLGKTVMVVPHVTNAIKHFIRQNEENADVILCEIGGTVGDIEALPFFEAIRQLKMELGKNNSALIHVALLPFLKTSGELKTKPVQHSVKHLQGLGLQPDILLCRAEENITNDLKEKLSLYCNIDQNKIVAAKNASNIYEIPLIYHDEGLDKAVFEVLQLDQKDQNLSQWQDLVSKMHKKKGDIVVGIVGKYTQLLDAYKSLNESLIHVAINSQVNIKTHWIDCEDSELNEQLKIVDAIIVPGGFGQRGIEQKIQAIQYARTNKVPFLGICLGMQLSLIEGARNLLNLKDASSTEFVKTNNPIISLMSEWLDKDEIKTRNINDDMGGSMRLGSFICHISKNTLAHDIYNQDVISERHRHRYEFNINYKKSLEDVGYVFSGMSEDNLLTEIIEYKDHPYFIATQFHPELISSPFKAHPLFTALIKKAIECKINNIAA